MQQGMLQTARNNVLDILEVRFETVPQSILKRLKEIEVVLKDERRTSNIKRPTSNEKILNTEHSTAISVC
jgi:hypothetical protein